MTYESFDKLCDAAMWRDDAPKAVTDSGAVLRKDATSGCKAFDRLCTVLITEAEMHWLYPCIERTRSTDWVATIRNRPEGDEDSYVMAHGQAQTMNAACLDAVEDYETRQRVKRRKQELLAMPGVVEALSLFGVAIPEQK